MKLASLVTVAAWISLSSCGQDIPVSKVPSVVQNTVQAKYSNALNIEWEKKKNRYEAEFNLDSTKYTILVDSTGHIILCKIDIPAAELPEAIKTAITRDHPSYTIDDAARLEKGLSVYYQAELELKGGKDKNLVFLADGTTIHEPIYIK